MILVTNTHTTILSTQLQANGISSHNLQCVWACVRACVSVLIFFLAFCAKCEWMCGIRVITNKLRSTVGVNKATTTTIENCVQMSKCTVLAIAVRWSIYYEHIFECRKKKGKLLIDMEHIFSCRFQTLVWSPAKSNEPMRWPMLERGVMMCFTRTHARTHAHTKQHQHQQHKSCDCVVSIYL